MHIRMNADKTKCVFVPCDRKRRRIPTIKPSFNNVMCEFATNIKYLGVIVDAKLLFKDHVEHAKHKVMNTLRKLTALHKPKVLDGRYAQLIVKQILMPQALYASAAWATVCNTAKINLRRKISISAKLFLNLDRMHRTIDLYQDMNSPLIEDIIYRAPHKLIARLENTNLPHLRELADRLRFVYDDPKYVRDVP